MLLKNLNILSFRSNIMRFSSKYKFWLISIVAVWGIGIVSVYFYLNLNINKNQPYHPHLQGHNKLPPANSFKMQRISKYCNFPFDLSSAQEGKINGNFSLVMVSIVIRHGDRSPLQPVRNFSNVPCALDKSLKHPLFKKYHNAISAAQRTASKEGPFKDFNLYPSQHCTLSHLTQRGAYQHLLLGSTLGQIYNTELNLLSKEKLNEQIKIYCTHFSRTYQSGLAFLFGFLPVFDFRSLEILPVPGIHFSLHKEFSTCPLLSKLLNQLSKKRSKMLESHPAVTRLVSYLQPIVFPNVAIAKQSAKSLSDCLMFYVCHSTHLPCLNQRCASFEQVRNLLAFNEWEGKQRAEDPIYAKASWLQIYGLLFDIFTKMSDLINGKRQPRFVLYSGHDVTLEPLLSALGISDGIVPPYTSRLVFELYASHERNQLQARHVLRIVYNGKDMTKFVSFCKDGPYKKDFRHSPDHCPFERLANFVRSTFFQSMNSASYAAACDLKNFSNSEEEDETVHVFESFN